MDTIGSQRTIAEPAVVAGFGYWSGQDVRVEFRPASPGTGIVFVRSDLAGCPRIAATIAHWVPRPRRTCLQSGSARVEMVEHVMAALGGLGIDNCEVWVDRAEMPGCDGSALPFVRALDGAGRVHQNARRPCRIVRELIRVDEGESWFEAWPPAGNQTSLTYHLDYGPASPVGRQSFQIILSPDAFRRELAGARTFMLKAEADWLLAQGLGTRATVRDLLVFDEHGPMDNPLRFDDECARHKLMDMVGDLTLTGCRLVGRFVAYRSGHQLNAEMVQAIVRRTEQEPARRRCA